MVDIETLSTDSNAIILTIAAIPFGPDGKLIMQDDYYFYEKIDLNSYNKYNNQFDFNWSTLLWWLQQDKEPLNDAFLQNPRYPIDTVLQDFINWLNITCDLLNDKRINIWSHGKDFDAVILQNAFKVCGLECPWKFWDTRDTRTIYAFSNVNLKNIPMPEGYKAHNAVGDCLKQIKGIEISYNIINTHKEDKTEVKTPRPKREPLENNERRQSKRLKNK